MRSGRSGSLRCWTLVSLLFLFGCTDKDQAALPPPADTWDGYCIDQDGDGYGFQCADGEDCDDTDPNIFVGCKSCTSRNEGCTCEANSAPIDCVVSKQIVEGSLLCKTGTRYCRDSKWSACEGVKTFEAPPPSHLLTRSLVDPDAGARVCSECQPDCYQIEDLLGADASYGDSGIVPSWNGGITLNSYREDSGVPEVDAGKLDERCAIGDNDCNGIPDTYEPYPDGGSPFASDHNTIFMDLGAGDTEEESFTVRFFLNTADIYLYMDMTGSMAGERTNLIATLRDGNYMPADWAGKECSDRNLNGRTDDEEYLKNEGVAGNLACMIRDSRLGAGWHRDLPFPRPDTQGFATGPHDFEAFQHEQDITDNVDAVLTGLNRFTTRGGINRPEGGIVGLYALATGSEIYMGWDRPGNPARSGCPAGTWGYPCFRDEAVPIVIWMTDAPITNGPAPLENQFETTNQGNQFGKTKPQTVDWDPVGLVIESGSDGKYTEVGKTHETFANAIDLGNINNSFRTYVFDSTGMASDITYASLTGSSSSTYLPATSICSTGTAGAWKSSVQTAPDAVFKFTVTEAEPVTISTRGSRVNPGIAIVDADRIDHVVTSLASANGTPGTATAAGSVSFPGVANISGKVSGSAIFSRDSLDCLANNTGSTDLLAGAVVKFNLASDASALRFVTDADSAVSTTLFSAQPSTFTVADYSLSSTLKVTDITNTTTTPPTLGVRSGNANDKMNAYNIGNLTGVYRRFTGGDASDTDLTADYSAAMFNNRFNCGSVTATAKDAVIDFSLSAPTRLRIDGTGNLATLQAGTIAAPFDHLIGLVSRGVPALHPSITGNNSEGTAYTINFSDIPSEYSWTQYNGTTGGSGGTLYLQTEVGPYNPRAYATTACSNAAAAGSTSLQSVFVLDIPPGTPTRSYDFDTGGSSVNSWLSLHKSQVRLTSSVVTANNGTTSTTVLGNSNGTSSTVVPQSLGVLNNASVFVTGGNLAASNPNSTIKFAQTNFGPGTTCASTINGKDAVYTFTVSGSTSRQVQVTTGATNGTSSASGNPAFNTYVGVFAGSISDANRVAGGCDDQSVTNASSSTANANAYDTGAFTASPGVTYYVVVKSSSTATAPGTYGLWVRDATNFLGCDYGSQPYASASVYSAKLTRSLGPGTYYVVVKTTGTSASSYQLNVRRTPTAEPSLMACDRTSGGATGRSRIEQTLPAGNYSLILRGAASSATSSAYNVIFRDMGVAPAPIACGYDANATTGQPSTFTATNLAARDGNGAPIDYYLVMRGNTSGTISYNTRIEDPSTMSDTYCAYDNVTMRYSPTTTLAQGDPTDIGNAEWTGTLPVGTYYAVLKGYDATDSLTSNEDNDFGLYQFTIGDQTNFERTGTFDAKRWLGPANDGVGGVKEALKNRKVRVIMVDSTTGSGDNGYYSDQQMRTIAQATDAVAMDGSPLFYKINQDGSGLGATIVSAVNTLAGNLAMDVGAVFIEAPDSPAPRHFKFRVEAIDSPGDLCQPPVDTDSDGVVDTHVKCTPGADPLFKITLSNPNPPYNVPRNPNDVPNGGWNMRVDLVADGQYTVDSIPVYVIPEDVIAQPGDKKYDAVGTYQDNVPSTGCVGNEAPLWKALHWTGSLPGGTSIAWNICTADTAAGLDSCTLQPAVLATTGDGCLTTANCTGNQFCNSDNLCESRIGPSCADAAECGVGGACVNGKCMWQGDVDVKPALVRSQQGKRFARVQVVMTANAARTRAPTVNSWQLNYTCTAQE
jgi:hypothetical protein